MKKASLSIFFTLLVVAAIAGSAFAEANVLPGTGWWSGEQIQNVGSASGQVDVVAYDSASTNQYNATATLDPGASKTFGPSDFTPAMPDGFQGSAIVSSSQDIRAIVTVTNRPSGTLGDPASPHSAGAQYQGMNVPATTLTFSLFKNNSNNKTTTFFIQNAGTVAATADYTFTPDDGTAVTSGTTPSIGPGQMVVLSPSTAGVASGKKGALTVTSTQPLAGSVLESFNAETHATLLQATRGATSADYDTKLYAPTNKRDRLNRFTGMNVMNVSGGPIDITVTYTGNAGACAGNTYTDSVTGLAAGAAKTFQVATALPTNCAASATVEGTGNIIGQVNESYVQPSLAPGGFQEATIYSLIPSNATTAFISIPQYKENASSKWTGLNVQNVGAANASVYLIFKNAAGQTYKTMPLTITPGAAKNYQQLRMNTDPLVVWDTSAGYTGVMTTGTLTCSGSLITDSCPGNYANFGVTVVSTQPVVAIANESATTPPLYQDKANYEGFNLASAP